MKELDFLPQSVHEARRQRQQTRRNTIFTVALCCGLAGLHSVNNTRIASAEAALQAVRTDNGAWRFALNRVQALQSTKRALQERADLISRLEDNAPLDAVLANITQLLGESMSIRSLVIEPELAVPSSQSPAVAAAAGESKDEQVTQPPVHVRLVGTATSDVEVGIFVGRLSGSVLFDNVKLQFSRQLEDGGMREFELRFQVRRVEINP